MEEMCKSSVCAAASGDVHNRLHAILIGISSIAGLVQPTQANDFDETFARCQEALLACATRFDQVSKKAAAAIREKQRFEEQVGLGIETLLEMGDRLNELLQRKCPPPAEPDDASVDAAAEYATRALQEVAQWWPRRGSERYGSFRRRCGNSLTVDSESDSGSTWEQGSRHCRDSYGSSVHSTSPRKRTLVDPRCATWDTTSNECRVCKMMVGTFLRPKHHCRTCGGVVCARCSPDRVTLEEGAKPERICTFCVGAMRQVGEVEHRLDQLNCRLLALTCKGHPCTNSANAWRGSPRAFAAPGLMELMCHAEDCVDMLTNGKTRLRPGMAEEEDQQDGSPERARESVSSLFGFLLRAG